MTTILDALVEKAARAIVERPPATIHGDYLLGKAREDARVALEAAAPSLIAQGMRASAAIADSLKSIHEDRDEFEGGWDAGLISCCGAILARAAEIEGGKG